MDKLTISSPNVKLVAFLYDLMRDDVVPGRVQELVNDAQTTKDGEDLHTVIFSNGYLAAYAMELAEMLTRCPPDRHVFDATELEMAECHGGTVVCTRCGLSRHYSSFRLNRSEKPCPHARWIPGPDMMEEGL